jgi:hypothetical protein
MITEEDKAWLAGVIDAQTRKKQKGNRLPYLNVMMPPNSAAAAQRVADLTGAPIYRNEWGSAGYDRKQCSEHCPEEHIHVTYNPNHVDNIRIAGHRLRIILRVLEPYLMGDYSDVAQAKSRYRPRWNVLSDLQRLGWLDSSIEITPHPSTINRHKRSTTKEES